MALTPALAGASEVDLPDAGPAELEEMLERLDLSDADAIYQEIRGNLREFVEVPGFRDLVRKMSKGESPLGITAFIKATVGYVFREILANAGLLGKLLMLAAVSSLLACSADAFSRGDSADSVTRLAEAVCVMVVAAMALSAFSLALSVASRTIGDITTLMLALLPALSALMAASGAPVTAGLLHPALVMTTYSASTLVCRYGLPLMMFAAAVEVAGIISDSFRLGGLVSFLRQTAILVLGVALSFFLGISVVHKAAGGVSDGLALRSAKFLSNALVPIVGKMFSDAVEVVFASSMLLRTALGAAGAALIILITAFPLAKVGILILVYRAASIFMQPVASKRVCDCLNAVATSLMTVWILMLAISLMGFVSLTVMTGFARGPVF